MLLFLPVTITIITLLPFSFAQQSIITNVNAIAVVIPTACVALCAPLLLAFNNCPSIAATIGTCFCTLSSLTSLSSCTTCMTTVLTSQADLSAAVPGTGAAGVLAACAIVAPAAVAGIPASATAIVPVVATIPAIIFPSSTTSTTSTTVAVLTPTVARGVTTITATATGTGSSSSTSTFVSSNTPPVTVKFTVYAGDNSAFPVQTKGASVFTSGAGAGEKEGRKFGRGIVLGGLVVGLLL